MFQRQRRPDTPVPLPRGARRLFWAGTAANVAAASWMAAAGDWLDHQSRISAVVTLGGHHLVLLWLAVIGFGLLAILAPVTGGFVAANRLQLAGLSVAGIVSVVALAGVLSVAALVVGVVLLAAVAGRAFIR